MTKRKASLSGDDKKSLYKRYLFWLYKTTKEKIDKIDRKFTQLDIDKDIDRILNKKPGASRDKMAPFLKEWKEYLFEKESDAQKSKFSDDGRLNPDYIFLFMKLEAIMQIVRARLGARVLKEFKRLYEEAAMRRIAEDISGRR